VNLHSSLRIFVDHNMSGMWFLLFGFLLVLATGDGFGLTVEPSFLLVAEDFSTGDRLKLYI